MARAPTDNDFHFEGFEGPNTTPVPDVVFDRLLTRLGEAELKALLYIIRRTFGFKKNRDPISFNQFLRGISTRAGETLDNGCGIKDRTSLSKALKSLEQKGIVRSEKGVDEKGENITTVYSLRFKDDPQRVVGNSYYRSMDNPPLVVGDSYPQETAMQDTVQQETGDSKFSPSDKNLNNSKQGGVRGEQGSRIAVDNSPAQAQERPSSFARVGQILASKGGSIPTRGRPPKPTPYIEATITDFSTEFHDEEHLRSNITQTMRLYKQSGLAEEAFVQRAYEARSITKDQGNIRKAAKDQELLRNKMPYFFEVLKDLLGLREKEAGEARPRGKQGDAGSSTTAARPAPSAKERFTGGKYGHLVKH